MRTDYEGTNLDAIRQMVALDMGGAFLPTLYADSDVPQRDTDVALVPFRRH
jgi:LysR family hydrogen peroxide-inducible transcriptional activator